MSRTTLNATIDRLREEVLEEQNAHRASGDAIRADRTLSAEGKQQQIAAAYLKHKARLDAMLEQEKTAIANERQTLERGIFGTVTNDPTTLIAYRDAQDRAQQLGQDDLDRATDMLKSAVLSSDATLAAAVLSRALAFSAFGGGPWQQVVDDYAAQYPTKGAALHELQAIEHYVAQQERDPFSGWYGFYYLATPTEIHGLSDEKIRAIAVTRPTEPVLYGSGQTW